MDPRRFLTLAPVSLLIGGCALLRSDPVDLPQAEPLPSLSAPAPTPAAVLAASPEPAPAGSTARPYRDEALTTTASAGADRSPAPTGRQAIAAANRSAREPSSADAFVGGVQRFAWREGRVYEVWTAPLRVTTLTLAPGEMVTAKAAGDTVRWQIGESTSGSGSGSRTHVLIKPLQSGLETNLVLTTNQRVYLLALRSGDADAFNSAITWDDGLTPPPGRGPDALAALPRLDVSAVTPQGPLDARYRIESRGRTPRWAPTAVFNDGVRTFITLSPEAGVDEAPALFVRADGELQLVNYRQAGGLLIVDRVFDEAELRLGQRRPQVVRIRRVRGAGR